MNARERQAGSTESDAEHALLLSYLNSAAWEERLAEARAKRQALLDGLGPEAARGRQRGQASPRAMVPEGVEPPPDAMSAGRSRDPSSATPAPVRSRWTYGLAASAAAFLVGASLLLQASGGTVQTSSGAGDLVTRNRTDTPAPLAPPPGSAGRLPQEGIDALAASLKEMAPANAITVVATARQAEALAGLDLANTAAQVRVTPFALDRPTVSYFHPADAEAAKLLAGRLDGETMDLTGLLPSPPDGALSVHLAGY